MKNAISEFVAGGGNLSSEAGVKLLNETDRSTIKEAAQNTDVAILLMNAREGSNDPLLRREILLALSD